MSSPTGINAGFGGTGPYRITSPTVESDATGGVVAVNANKTFATNLPLGFGMAITDVEWIAPIIDYAQGISGTALSIWQTLAQLTEALARTSVVQADNIDVDVYFDEVWQQSVQATAVGFNTYMFNRNKALERHHLSRPWLSVAQNLNLIASVVPTEAAGGNGPEFQVFTRIYFDIVPLTTQQQAYLAQRLQISGQA